MRRVYCTLFDKNYLYQAIALYNSLLRYGGEFQLFALCMDSVAFVTIRSLNCPTLTPIYVDDLLDSDVVRVRARTTHGQFCWVCQPLICQHILERYKVDMVTYLEADSMFFSSPEPLFAEMGARSATLVPHNFSAGIDNGDTAGTFCVQFNAFRGDSEAASVLQYWRECCFRYDRSFPQQYPGQTTLDEWPLRYPSVAVLRNIGAGVAPWNVMGYELEMRNSVPFVNGTPTIFFHYHQYGRFRSGAHELGSYPLSAGVVDTFYRPYVSELSAAASRVRSSDPSFSFRREYEDPPRLFDVLGRFSRDNVARYATKLKRRLRGRYNVYPDSFFSDIPSTISEG